MSLKLRGVVIPNNSFVDFDDLLYRTNTDPDPSNARPELHDQALLCVTDLIDCCESPSTVRGDWYYPDGQRILFDGNPRNLVFRRNRGQNEIINGRQFYGSVRLWRRFSPTERGRFRCELPNAADSSVNQTLYVNIGELIMPRSSLIASLVFSFTLFLHSIVHFGAHKVAISVPNSHYSLAGETYSLQCSATLLTPIPLPSNVPSPNFEWYFGPNGNAPLSSGVIAMATVLNSGNTYTSTLQFSPLSQSHSGNYTCRLGAASLANNVVVTVSGKADYYSLPLATHVTLVTNV